MATRYLAATKIDLKGDKGITVQWNDGHTGIYPYRYLRAQCTCAFCKHEWTGKRLVFEDQVSPNVYPVNVNPVGRYGVSFTWDDGHSAGIYTFDNLRALCQCVDCTGTEPPERTDIGAQPLVAAFETMQTKKKGGCGGGGCGCN
jgi:DUF971 family protein